VIPNVGATIRIEAETRWDALDLLSRLSAYHTYLVQLGERRWSVCVRPHDDPERLTREVLVAAHAWAQARGVISELRVGDRVYRLGGAGTAATATVLH